MPLPQDQLLSGAVIALASIGATWAAIFVARLFIAPSLLYAELKDRIDALEAQIGAPNAAFELVYDPTDAQWAQPEPNGTRFFVGLHVLAHRTIDHPNVWALRGLFTNRVFAHLAPHPSGSFQIYQGGAIDWGVTERFELCFLPSPQNLDVRGDNNPLASTQRFALQIRGRNCQAVTEEFEYDPSRIPMIRKLS